MYDIVMVGGVEKMTSQSTRKVTEILAAAGDMDAAKARAGATFPALFAHDRAPAHVSVRNHARATGRGGGEESPNGAKNPQAHMRKVITMEQALAGKPIADPLTVYDCSLISDGAAAV